MQTRSARTRRTLHFRCKERAWFYRLLDQHDPALAEAIQQMTEDGETPWTA